MKTDPRNVCANTRQHLGWALLHDAIAHPLMALSGYSAWSLQFHNWTSARAWPRTGYAGLLEGYSNTPQHGRLEVRAVQPWGFYAVRHGHLDRVVVIRALSWPEAAHDAERLFDWLEEST